MQKLFFELIKVALGQLDCVDRAPLEEEWPKLYQMARQHGIAGTCYLGVEKLFEFGLRGPLDLMLDWMAESEETFDADIIEHYSPIPMKNPFKNWVWKNIQRDYAHLGNSQTLHLLSLFVHIHEQYYYHRLPLLLLIDAHRMLRQMDGHFDPNRAVFEQLLRRLGILRFTQGVMWALGEITGLERRYMPCEPLERKGRPIIDDIMTDDHSLKRRLKRLLS